MITPNHEEAPKMLKKEASSIEETGEKLSKQLKTNVLITRGKDGMTLFRKNKIINFPTQAREVYDRSGAGDTVVSTIILALASGADMETAAYLANIAAGIVVGKTETATTNLEEMINIINL